MASTLFSASALASTGNCAIETKYDKTLRLCGVIVTFYDSNNQPYNQQWYTSDQPTLDDCKAYQASVIADLQRQGYRVSLPLTEGLQPSN